VLAISIVVFITTRVSSSDTSPRPLSDAQEASRKPLQPTLSATPTAAPLDKAGCSTDTYGGVTQRVQDVGHYLVKKFKINKVVGKEPTSNDDSAHLAGLALDFYFSDKESGDEFAQYLAAHRDLLDINYIIWWQRVYIDDQWVTMSDRGTEHANHYDNVHVSFRADPQHTLTCE
jgi:hypothetical protein